MLAGMSEDEVLAVNERFYEAFAQRDREAMARVWAEKAPVVCIHPGWPPVRGRTEVLASWAAIFQHDESPPIRCEAPSVTLFADTATVVCRERIGNSVLAATNIYAREDGGWTLVHHHASGLAMIPKTPDLDPEFLAN